MVQMLSHYFLSHGRIARATCFGRIAILGTLCCAFGLLAGELAGKAGQAVVSLVFVWGVCTVSIQRLHDSGRGGLSIALMLIPVIGPLWVFLLLCRRGAEGPNRHGLDARARLDYLRVDISR